MSELTGITHQVVSNADLPINMRRPLAVQRNKVTLHIDSETREILYAFAFNATPYTKYGTERRCFANDEKDGTQKVSSISMTHYWTKNSGWQIVRNEYQKIV